MEGQPVAVFGSKGGAFGTHPACFQVGFPKKRGSIQAIVRSFTEWRVVPVCRDIFSSYRMAGASVIAISRKVLPVR